MSDPTALKYQILNARARFFESKGVFEVPSDQELERLTLKSIVKIIFTGEGLPQGVEAERMWVTITEINGDALKGVLDNAPAYLTGIKFGDTVSFKKQDIIQVHKES